MPEPPARMLQRGREPDQDFASDEHLYRRFAESDFQGGELHTDQIPFYPALSVNRQKYGKPKDVLYPNYFQDFGVFQFMVRDIPPPYATEGSKYTWKPIHAPEPANYAHSEVRTLKDGVLDYKLKIKSNLVKKWFRECLRDRAQIVITPRSATPD